MLRWITGLNEPEKESLVYEEIGRRCEKQELTWVLVPEQFSLYMEKEILRRFSFSAQQYVKVISFSRLCNLVLRHKGPLRMRYVDGAGKQILAARTMELLTDKLMVLSRNMKQKGFAKVLAETVSECKRYGVSPQALRFAAEQTEQEDLSQKLFDLSQLYETYDNLLSAQSADAEDNLSLICEKLPFCEFLQGGLYVMHFRSFTPVEYRALSALMGRMDITVALRYSNRPQYGGLFSPMESVKRNLNRLAEEQGIAVLPEVTVSPQKEDSALSYLAARYFDARAKAWEGDSDQVALYETKNTYTEVASAADLILRLCRMYGYRFSDILVLARDMETYRRITPAIFERRGIRVFLDTRRNITAKPLVRLIFGILDILAYGYSYERVMAVAGCGLLPIEQEALDELENYILLTAPTPAVWQAETWDYLPGHGTFDLERINRTKNCLFSGVKAMEKEIQGRKTGGEIAGAVLKWLKESGVADTLTERAQKALDSGKPELADEYAQVWNGTLSVLSQIGAQMQETPMTYRRFAELFETACGGIEVGMTPQTLDCVTFSQIDRFRSSHAKAVLVLGMNEGVFPRGYMTEGLLSDAERQAMLELGVELAPGRESKRKEEQLLIYEVLNAPTERLYLFRPVGDSDGKAQIPSDILKRVRELLPETKVYTPEKEELLGGAQSQDALFDQLATKLAEFGGEEQFLPKPLRELYEWFSSHEMFGARLKELTDAMTAEPPAVLNPDMVRALYGDTLSLSVSRLESYNGCAFRYFLAYGLFAGKREKAGLEPTNKGSIQHAALYEYFTVLKEQQADYARIEKEDCFRQVGEAVEREARKNAELLYESSAYYQYIVMRMKGIATRTAWEVVKFYRSGSFRPYGFEIRIGTGAPIPAISVTDQNGEEIARLRGVIDRADVATVGEETVVSVVDYKSSAKGLDVRLAEDGITLQPLLYADAICKAIPNAVPAGMMYLQMNDPIVTEDKAKDNPELAINKEMRPHGWLMDDAGVSAAYGNDGKGETFLPSGVNARVSREDLLKRIEKANQKIVETAMGIRGGNIQAEPYRTYQYDACEYCPYASVCQKELCGK
ncbi:MAG: PD-(D/E)XK nuclease family protein [Clostridia bacterium]|nr:PD-(D/E)XK nuclease family protein [Clostridia bacterium]